MATAWEHHTGGHKPSPQAKNPQVVWPALFPCLKFRRISTSSSTFKNLLCVPVHVYTHVWTYMCHGLGMEIRGQLEGVGSLILPCMFWGVEPRSSGMVAGTFTPSTIPLAFPRGLYYDKPTLWKLSNCIQVLVHTRNRRHDPNAKHATCSGHRTQRNRARTELGISSLLAGICGATQALGGRTCISALLL